MNDRKKHPISEVIEMLGKKKGSGKSKTTKVDISIAFKTSITKATATLMMIEAFLAAMEMQTGFEYHDNSVTTEFEDNKDIPKYE